METEPDEVVAAFDSPAAMALLLSVINKASNGRVLDGPTHGNCCSVHVLVNNVLEKYTAAADKELHHSRWWDRLPKILKEEFRPHKVYVIAWTLSSRRFYNLQPGDVILDTRDQVKYAVVPSRRKKTGRRIRRET